MSNTTQSSSQASTFSTLNETLEESTIDQDQFLAIKTSSALNSTNNARSTSSSHTLLNTLQYQNNHGSQNINSNNTIELSSRSDRRSQNSDHKLRIHTARYTNLLNFELR
ncbi:11302_t:CDS:2 [Gigaspora margarita]|uniref:11302_t:CDS:1 n=1 Tax=Gigaspora margarita TaxID=4874 RepID=A0ABN7V2K6_GIGMA|nr:11302_t:CDS:2 [Gigaspora margarita]